jgi:FdrA protein
MAVVRSETRPGAYYDSAVLMQLQRGLLDLPGVADAGVVMATPANCELLEQSGLLTEAGASAGPNDLLIVVRAASDDQAADALAQVDGLLARRKAVTTEAFRPRSLDTALRQLPETGWVLVSVPGRYAGAVARQALLADRHVFLYSDNVPLDDEVSLKQLSRSRGLLMMGPDCGTAIINGVGFGFANRVRRGPIGLAGASGTGLQAVTSSIHNLGGGVSHALGTGGRDLKESVGAITALQALDALARDAGTQVIVLVSKPPAPAIAARLLGAAQGAGKPVVVNFIGYPPPARRLGNLHFALSLSHAAELAVSLVNEPAMPVNLPAARTDSGRYVRGLFSGGTIAYEVVLGLQALLAPLYTNVPIYPEQQLPDPMRSQAHTVLDLGDDVFTVGRLHPMLDNDLRLRRLRQEAADPDVGLILLDVVLGEGAHPDPASELAPAIAGAASRGLDVAAIVIGTDKDPQTVDTQVERLSAAGAVVFRDTGQAVAYAGARLAHSRPASDPPVSLESLSREPLAAVNIGLEAFHASLLGQGAEAVHVDWRPPAGGNEKLMDILSRMKK